MRSDTSNLVASNREEDLWNERKGGSLSVWNLRIFVLHPGSVVVTPSEREREGEREGGRETSKKASTARGHLGRKEKTTARNRMEPCWSSILPRKIAIRACTITSQIKVIFTSLHLDLKGNALSVFQTQIDSEMNYCRFAPKNFSAEGVQLRRRCNKYQWQSGFHTTATLAAR